MRLGADRSPGPDDRLGPATPQRVRITSFCAAVALHGLAVVAALLYRPGPAKVSIPAIEVALIVEQAGPAAPERSEPAEPVETMEAMADPVPPPERAEPPPVAAEAPEPDVEPPVEPAPVESVAPPVAIAATPLPPAPPPRPSPPTPAAPVATPQPAEPPRALVDAEAPAIAVAPAPRAAVSRAETDYVGALLGWLERYKEYPRAARLRRLEGTAMVRLAILADGSLGTLSLVRSSGHAMLDDAAIDMVRRAAPLPRPPHAPCELEVPVVFAQSRP
jgi:protein TonB